MINMGNHKILKDDDIVNAIIKHIDENLYNYSVIIDGEWLSKEQYEDALAEGDRILQELCTDIAATEQWCNAIRCCGETDLSGRTALEKYKKVDAAEY